MKTILYVEESQNAFASAIIRRKDIQLILLRFANCMSFSGEHLEETQHIPTFVIDKAAPIEQETQRLDRFLKTVCDHVDWFFNDSEFNQVYIQRVASALRLPGALTETQADTVRDKYRMKCFVRSLGWNCPDFVLLRSREDADDCAHRWGFPFIIKWRTGVSSIEVYSVSDFKTLDKLRLDYSSGRYLAEQFQTDKIWCLDAIVQNGAVAINLYTWLPYTNLSFAEDKNRFLQIAVGHPPGNWKFDPRRLTQDIVDGLSLQSGYLHLEVFISGDGKPSVCEFGWRTPGDHMLQNFSLLYGFRVEDCLLDALLGLPVSPPEETDDCVADVFLPLKTGTVTAVSNLEELRKQCDLLDGEIYYHVGDTLTSRHKYTDAGGWVQIRADGIEALLRKADTVYDSFILEVKGN